ncbi:transketolase C-terminal domain-containing protein [Adlercreutzia sp. ZJ138]|uniref:transketolase C-terminal domain-containing protein n=1 Tax=Adlercreutzia sp. ZJ138 TaxID=2709405 RepID=UPI0013EAFA58|nr:transketolase C-terminal domain-containing protein [Adlercreutzia sp. ZJ138]
MSTEIKAFSATGNQMVAEAMRQAEPDVMAAYPITPQTTIVESFAKFVADGRVHTEYVTVESEHSALSACVGASAAGARVATATASQGLALMWEELHITAGMRLPIVMANANRALAAPINIHCDHSDIMGARDTGWIIMFAETAQEAYDNTVVSFKVAEDARVQLPVLTTLDGFTTSHAMERCEMEDDDTVRAFVGDYVAAHPLLDTDNPVGCGSYALGDCYMKTHLACRRANTGALSVIEEHGKAWEAICGRPFNVVDTWGTEDADYVVVVLGSAAGNARHIARELRAQGRRVGVVRPKVFRPFPAAAVAAACKTAKAVAVMDRSDSIGAAHGPLGAEVISALHEAGLTMPVKNYIFGLGGQDLTNELMTSIFDTLEDVAAGTASPALSYLGFEE